MIARHYIPRYDITQEDRQRLNGHKSYVLWLTGLSGSGKSTLANMIEGELYRRTIRSYVLDGDKMRSGLNSNLSFSVKDRRENSRRIGEVAKLLVDAGIVVIVALISPFQSDRDEIRHKFSFGEFIEVFVKCPIDVCESRDPKGLYKKARTGEIELFTGISSPYEPPMSPEIVIDTNDHAPEEAAQIIMSYLEEKSYLN